MHSTSALCAELAPFTLRLLPCTSNRELDFTVRRTPPRALRYDDAADKARKREKREASRKKAEEQRLGGALEVTGTGALLPSLLTRMVTG